jgi:hypothetical protein
MAPCYCQGWSPIPRASQLSASRRGKLTWLRDDDDLGLVPRCATIEGAQHCRSVQKWTLLVGDRSPAYREVLRLLRTRKIKDDRRSYSLCAERAA